MAYHYTDSGLDNVYLENGFTVHKTPYGEGISIQNTEGLHQVIGRSIVMAPKAINGAELRFLRLEMDLTQRSLAAFLGSTEQNVRRWEKARRTAIPGPADRLLRLLYSEYSGGDGSVRSLVERLAELDQIDSMELHLLETGHGWQAAHAA
ncbi:helix-turn-helix domain-containing protein [Microvirga subterranea]|uniref:DNA-binding transcriptional regulator YiaG n=1 Tax=Microvirga subterranea TaxID=186651 RepID=A0A370HJM0_9HYPH|nr:transcriptional regulator [Microvirga subterranea]RDI58708.1 DNA-binding transcriptional regulator YiaG [Microvirga subterranea]